MNQQIRLLHLLQSCLEGREQIARQISNETDGVIDDDLLFLWQPQPTAGRIERREHPLLGRYLTVRERIEQGALTRIGVADD